MAGLEMGGIAVVTALGRRAGLPCAVVRKTAKSCGTARLAEGADVIGRKAAPRPWPQLGSDSFHCSSARISSETKISQDEWDARSGSSDRTGCSRRRCGGRSSGALSVLFFSAVVRGRPRWRLENRFSVAGTR